MIHSLERLTEVLYCHTLDSIPRLESLRKLPREKELKLTLDKSISGFQVRIGNQLKVELPEFSIGIHSQEPIISIARLITDSEIETHQYFFEQCAKDYRTLANQLIYELVAHLNIELDQSFPLETFTPFIRDRNKYKGKLNGWSYYFHGFHCNFTNDTTEQIIEVPLTYGREFGELDPYFFSGYIKSTPKYQPLPAPIYDDYADGKRILEKMVNLGKAEVINSNIKNQYGTVVADREKIQVSVYPEIP
jgi:hypothetical protein